jgi:hypothetical protein
LPICYGNERKKKEEKGKSLMVAVWSKSRKSSSTKIIAIFNESEKKCGLFGASGFGMHIEKRFARETYGWLRISGKSGLKTNDQELGMKSSRMNLGSLFIRSEG